MGASGWNYLVPYQADLAASLDALRRQVFAEKDYVDPESGYGIPSPETVEGLWEEEYGEFMGNCGTHSIIDVWKVDLAEFDSQEFGTVRPLTADEARELFGTDKPTRQDFERLSGKEGGYLIHDAVAEKWTGRAATLWDGDIPSETAFWGFSGD